MPAKLPNVKNISKQDMVSREIIQPRNPVKNGEVLSRIENTKTGTYMTANTTNVYAVTPAITLTPKYIIFSFFCF